ncbi:MAG: undecaprenyldiphospho-muramoylpentapeptide beta-N-acetylglucosaminyltransferase [Chitinivibrionales bacterium]|nr:undecaprenyldiphospho-muramoylpentapeptide beta-N-acetylglucosaminyltransferase [Chitinivibrionales bacterium]
MRKKTIVFTGGGTAGHVTPNLALITVLKPLGIGMEYVGSRNGIERSLVQKEGIAYNGIHAGKLRRYFDIKNFFDVFNIGLGFFESLILIARLRPALVFSKGGFVACPVVWAAWCLRVPVFIHESDMTPGLTNKLSSPFAAKILYSFAETARFLSRGKGIHTGLPIRSTLKNGNRAKGFEICQFTESKPMVLIIGGSMGSGVVNQVVRQALVPVLSEFHVCHLCGKGNKDDAVRHQGYHQMEFASDELPHLFAAAEVIVSRAGATTLFEILSLQKASLLIPLGKNASRGDQIENAAVMHDRGYCNVLYQEDMNAQTFTEAVLRTYADRQKYRAAIQAVPLPDGTAVVCELIKKQLALGECGK